MQPVSTPATIAVMTGVVVKRWLFFRWRTERWRSFERGAGLAEFRTRFVAFAARMVVVAPEFANFDARFDQTFAFVPLGEGEGGRRRRTTWSDDELAFFRRCLAKLGSHRASSDDSANVALVPGRFLVEDGRRWTAPFDVIERDVELLSRRACVDRILPALAAGIGPEEGGLYAPYGGDGAYMLASM
jgi:hypothetical protein